MTVNDNISSVRAEAVNESQTSHSIQKTKNANVFSAFAQSFSSIVVSELGDKTFFIAAIMAMRYNRIAVLSGALAALFLTLCLESFSFLFPLEN